MRVIANVPPLAYAPRTWLLQQTARECVTAPRRTDAIAPALAMPLPHPTTLKHQNPTRPKKKPDPAPTEPAAPSPESSSLSFTIETFDDPETGQPTQYGRFSRHWQDQEALDVLIDKLKGGQLSQKQAGNSELHCQPAVGTGPAG